LPKREAEDSSPFSVDTRNQYPSHIHGEVVKKRNTFSLLHVSVFTLCFHLGKIPLKRSRHRWDDNIKMYLSEMDFAGVD
jgi:hypothetical protein